MGTALQYSGEIAESLGHYKQALALYDPTQHRSLMTRFNVDTEVAVLHHRSQALWLLGYSDAVGLGRGSGSEWAATGRRRAIMPPSTDASFSEVSCAHARRRSGGTGVTSPSGVSRQSSTAMLKNDRPHLMFHMCFQKSFQHGNRENPSPAPGCMGDANDDRRRRCPRAI